jgi:hypothetical protein
MTSFDWKMNSYWFHLIKWINRRIIPLLTSLFKVLILLLRRIKNFFRKIISLQIICAIWSHRTKVSYGLLFSTIMWLTAKSRLTVNLASKTRKTRTWNRSSVSNTVFPLHTIDSLLLIFYILMTQKWMRLLWKMRNI